MKLPTAFTFTAFTAMLSLCSPLLFRSPARHPIPLTRVMSSKKPTITPSNKSFVSSITSSRPPKLIFLTGKGGVGKTTTSSSLALLLSSLSSPKTEYPESPSNILIVSTDPASSVYDAFQLPPPSSIGEITPILSPLVAPTSTLSITNLNAESSTDSLNGLIDTLLKKLDADTLAKDFGVSPAILSTFGVADLVTDLKASLSSSSSKTNLLPPGSDELLQILSLLKSDNDYDLVIADTAPSGHTIRMLNGPKFIDSSLAKIIKFKSAADSILGSIARLGGAASATPTKAQATLSSLVDKIDAIQTTVRSFETMLEAAEIKIALVAIPTKLSFEETVRTAAEVNALSPGKVVRELVINQVLPANTPPSFIERRVRSQRAQIDSLSAFANDKGISIHEIPYLNTEIVGVPGLSYLGNTHLATVQGLTDRKVLVFGGKGGVGKTTTSAATAVYLANQGYKVAVVSTDPAHSLGDAFDVDMSGKTDGVDLSAQLLGGGKLVAFEIDTKGAITEFQVMLRKLSPPPALKEKTGVSMGDIAGLLETLPPGSDEIIALSKLVHLMEKSDYDKIVIDTAPTGHALRLLTYPRFLDDLIERVIGVSEKVLPALRLLGGSQMSDDDLENAKMKLLIVQISMFKLDEMFSDEENTEFVGVTIPTQLAVAETMRLVQELEEGEVKMSVRRVLVNQVAGEGDGEEAFVAGVRRGQAKILKRFANWASKEGVGVSTMEVVDEEPKGVYGLSALWPALTKEML